MVYDLWFMVDDGLAALAAGRDDQLMVLLARMMQSSLVRGTG